MSHYNSSLKSEVCGKCELPVVGYSYQDHDDCVIEGICPFLVALHDKLSELHDKMDKISQHVGATERWSDD